jgi:2-aminoadipate transaminase
MAESADLTGLYSKIGISGAPRWEALASDLGGDNEIEPDPQKVTYNFDQGLPAPESIPVADLRRLFDEVCEMVGPMAFEYFDPAVGYEELVYGDAGLRDSIAARLARNDSSDVGRMGVLLTSGSCQGISLAVHAFMDPGDGAVVENVTFPYTVKYIENLGGHVRYADVDKDGCDPESVEEQLKQLQSSGIRPKLVYISGPTFQTPTGMTMPLERRKRLVEIIQKWGVVLLEDAVYRDLRFEGEHLPSLFSLDDSGLVLQADSFSKTVAPGLRLGWVAGRPDAIGAVSAGREDLGVSQMLAKVMKRFLDDGLYEPHVRRASEVLRKKRDVAVRALREHVGDAVTFNVPSGSLYLWLKLSEDVDWSAVQRNAFEAGVYCRPGERFSNDPSFQQFLRLQYSYTPVDEIERGIEVFGKAVAASRKVGVGSG